MPLPLPKSSPISKVAFEKLAIDGSSTLFILRLFFLTTTNRIIAQVAIPNKSNLKLDKKKPCSYNDKTTIIIVFVVTVGGLDISLFAPVGEAFVVALSVPVDSKDETPVDKGLLVVALSVVCFRVVTVISKVVNPVVDCKLEVCGDDVRIPEVSD